MRWTPGRISGDIEDRRGSSGWGGGGLRIGGGAGLVLLILSLIFGRNLMPGGGGVDTGAAPGPDPTGAPVASTPEEDRLVQFVSFVLNDVQDTWTRIFEADGRTYRHAHLVLFRQAVESGCGVAETAAGPFYCPEDERVYIDLGFYDELRRRFGAPGDFAQAYVIAHELGHHVQHLLGTEDQVRRAQASRPDLANDLSVRLELQADCYAGVWGHSTQQRDILEQGDVQEGLDAAAAVGDDRIQKMTGQGIHPESFTHGTSAQRVAWFKRGFANGNPDDCDTFAANGR